MVWDLHSGGATRETARGRSRGVPAARSPERPRRSFFVQGTHYPSSSPAGVTPVQPTLTGPRGDSQARCLPMSPQLCWACVYLPSVQAPSPVLCRERASKVGLPFAPFLAQGRAGYRGTGTRGLRTAGPATSTSVPSVGDTSQLSTAHQQALPGE